MNIEFSNCLIDNKNILYTEVQILWNVNNDHLINIPSEFERTHINVELRVKIKTEHESFIEIHECIISHVNPNFTQLATDITQYLHYNELINNKMLCKQSNITKDEAWDKRDKISKQVSSHFIDPFQSMTQYKDIIDTWNKIKSRIYPQQPKHKGAL